MVVTYRGHEIKVVREKCLGGWNLLYYSALRIADGFFVVDSFEDSAETVRDKVKQLKEEIDDRIANPQDWEEGDE